MNIKKFFIRNLRNIFAVIIISGLTYGVYTTNPDYFNAPKAEAGATEKVSGFVWSENIGWISLNSTSDGSAISYGVDVNPVDTTGIGTFSGSAWSENVGWISFAQSDLSICPPGATVAQVNWATGKVTGWARSLNGSATSGWDGCIKFSDDTVGVWNGNGVKIDTAGKFSGYAWGGDVVGWIDFNPLVGGLPITNRAKVPVPCVATNPTLVWGACDASASCVSGAPTQSGLVGVRYGVCADGSTGTVIDPTCVAPSTNCSGARNPSTGIYIYGDGTCDLGETLANSPVDCKPETKFLQF